MDSAPLVIAHTHARNAAAELSKANTSAASAEHDLAAGEFSKASAATEDTEALRILKLLEEYHRSLAKTIKAEPRTTAHTRAHYDASSGLTLTSASSAASPHASSQSPSQTRTSKSVPRQRARDLSSSIASNLASARGIPGAQSRRGGPVSPTVTAHTAVGNGTSRSRSTDLSPSSAVEAARQQLRPDDQSIIPRPIVPVSSSDRSYGDHKASLGTQHDTAFHRFYSNFEGYFSTLTAPLVFAGFPLNPSPNSAPSNVQNSQPVPTKAKAPAPPSNSHEPELSGIFSKSALRALRDANGLNAPAESFYVVPTSGGTVSYAQMVTHNKQALDHRNSVSADNEEFVDASETPYPPSPNRSKHSLKGSPSASRHTPAAGGKVRRGKTLEELELETHQQRDIIDNLSKRLVQFETHSQQQRLALAQSMHSQRPSSRAGEEGQDANTDIPPVPPLPKSEPSASPEKKNDDNEQPKDQRDPRVAELEASLAALQKENAKLARESERRGSVINQYREKWDELKSAARKKAREREASAATAANETDASRERSKGQAT